MDANEQTILNKIQETTYKFLVMLNEIKRSKQTITNDVKMINNNYFIEKTDIFYKFNDLFDDYTLNGFIEEIDLYCKNIKETMDNVCLNHEYIEDYIDISIDKDQKIRYCKKCHVSQSEQKK